MALLAFLFQSFVPMDRVLILMAIVLQMTSGQIGPGQCQEGDDLLLKCSIEILSSKLPDDTFEVLKLVLGRRTSEEDIFSKLMEYDLKCYDKCGDDANYTNPLITARGWSAHRSNNQEIFLKIRAVETSDAGIYLCQGLIMHNENMQLVNITQKVTVASRPSSQTESHSGIPTPAIIGLVVSLAVLALLAVALFYLLKNQCEHGKRLQNHMKSFLENSWVSRCWGRIWGRKRQRRQQVLEIKEKYQNKPRNNRKSSQDHLRKKRWQAK